MDYLPHIISVRRIWILRLFNHTGAVDLVPRTFDTKDTVVPTSYNFVQIPLYGRHEEWSGARGGGDGGADDSQSCRGSGVSVRARMHSLGAGV